MKMRITIAVITINIMLTGLVKATPEMSQNDNQQGVPATISKSTSDKGNQSEFRQRAQSISQEEVDSFVDNGILMCIHDDDALEFENSIKERGATNEMLAQAYLAVAHKTKNAVRGSTEAGKFSAAVGGFVNCADNSQLTNLLQIAESTTNELSATDALLTFCNKVPCSRDFVTWGDMMLQSTDVTLYVKSSIWEKLDTAYKANDATMEIKTNILSIARKSLTSDPSSVFYADRILAENDPLYRDGGQRKQIANEIISRKDTIGMNPTIKAYFQSVSGDTKTK